MSDLAQYIAAIMLNRARMQPQEAYGGSLKRIAEQLRKDVGFSVKEEDVGSAVNILTLFGAAEQDFSPLTGGYWTIVYDNFRYHFIEDSPEEEDDAESYRSIGELAENFPILKAYSRRGQAYAVDAAAHLKDMSSAAWESLRDQVSDGHRAVPASNRIVTLQHNQKIDLEDAANEVVSAVEKENSFDGDISLRQIVVGQLRAGREMIRAGVFRAYLLQQTLFGVLGGLIERYKGQAIGHAAKKLFDLLIEHIFGK